MTVRNATFLLGAGVLLLAGSAVAGEDEKKMPEQGEVRVFVSNPKGEPLGGDKATVTVYLDYGGFKKTLKTEAVTPKKDAGKKEEGEDKEKGEAHHGPESHGGQMMTSDDYTVELVVAVEEEHEKGEKAEEHVIDEPYFEAKAPLVAYQDSMKDSPPAEKAGKCAKCGLDMKAQPAAFSAVVVVKVGDKTINAKGFKYPEEMPKTLAEAAKKIESALAAIDELVAGKKLDDVHKVAEGISKVAEHLGEIAPAADKAALAKLGKEIVDLFEAIDKAADAGKADDTEKVMTQYREKLAALKKLVK
jgi:hypothetical protein